MNVKIILDREDVIMPSYETEGSSGMDIRAKIDIPYELEPLERALIPTGIFLEIPEGYEAQVRPRSGLAIKKGLTVLNAPGTIDSDYRGEVGVVLINLSNNVVKINNGDRIAQLVFTKVEKAELKQTQILTTTARGFGGFGSTGTK